MNFNLKSHKKVVLFLLCLIAILPLPAQNSNNVTVTGNNLSVVGAIEQIEKQTQITIAYNKSQLSALPSININVTNQPVAQALTAILSNTGYTFRRDGNNYVIVPEARSTPRTGTVADEQGNPIIGATIVLKDNQTVGVATNAAGAFTINALDGSVLIVSSLGYLTKEVPVGSATNINVVLSDDVQRLDDVVVVGYNTVRRAQTTGSMSRVSGEQLDYMSAPTLESRLQGMTPGLMVATSSGQPGTNYLNVRVRGTGSINGANTPLYIMDGVMVEPFQFAALNPNDIEDIKVLKDAASTAVYGSRGANGVIVITTKSGGAVEGKTQINYRNQFGFSVMDEYVKMMNSEQNLQYQLQCALSDPSRSDFPLMGALYREYNGNATDADLERLAKARSTDTDWIDQMTRVGFIQDHSLTVSGGTERTKFYISGNIIDQQGILKNSGMTSFSGRFNIEHRAKDWLDIGLKLTTGYSMIDFSDPSGETNRTSYLNPWFTALLAYPYESPDDWYDVDNPTLLTKYLTNKTKKLKLIGSTFVNARITDWLTFRTNFGMDFMYDRSDNTLHRDHPNASNNKGYYSFGMSELGRYTWTNTLSFNKTFDNGHSVNAVAGMEMFQGKYYSAGYTGYDLNADMMDSPAGIGDKNGSSEFPPSISGGRTMSNLMSFFGQASYSIGNKYNISASLRHDTSSKFKGKNKDAVFWSAGVSWNLYQEEFFNTPAWLNLLKVRASYGTTGNQDGVADFGSYDGYTNSSYNGISGYANSQLGNNQLKWETSQQANVGFDLSFLDQKINMTLDLYHIKTKDLFMTKNISMTSGFGSILTNAGSIVNKGIEIGFNATPIRTKDFTWDIGVNFTYNKNKIKDLGTWENEDHQYINGYYLYEVGRPLGTWTIWEWAGVNPDNGIVQFYKPDGTLTEDISEAARPSKYGTYEIPVFGGFNTTFRYKSLTLNAQFTYALNYTLMNTMRWYIYNHHFNGNKPVEMLDMWMEPGDVTNIPRFGNNTQPSPMASQFLEDATHLRLKTLRLAYTLPQHILKKTKFFDNIAVYVQAENVFLWTNYTGADPEVAGGYDYMTYPKPRTFTFGFDFYF